jgi:hypothetical protein
MYGDLVLDISRRLDELGETKFADILFKTHIAKQKSGKRICTAALITDDIERTLISAKHMKDGYEIRKEIWSAPWTGGSDVEMESVYNHHGNYIGDKKTAKMLIEKSIVPEISKESHSVCSIGYSPKEGKWFGWSHRAMKGFGIGDYAETCLPGGGEKSKDKIKTFEEAKKAAIAFAESVS